MLEIAELIATLTCALFTGAAVYVSLVEQPARLACPTDVAATEWVPSYSRAAVMQSALAAPCVLAAIAAGVLGGGVSWLLGAGLVLLVVPFTLIIIMPTNRKLLDPTRQSGSKETQSLLEHWGRLHNVRTALSLTALVLFIRQLIWH